MVHTYLDRYIHTYSVGQLVVPVKIGFWLRIVLGKEARRV